MEETKSLLRLIVPKARVRLYSMDSRVSTNFARFFINEVTII